MPDSVRLDAQATDAIGRVWLLLVRVDGAASIWRIGEKVAETPWSTVRRVFAESATPERAAESVLSTLAHEATEGLVPLEILKEFARPVAAWIDRHAKLDEERRFG